LSAWSLALFAWFWRRRRRRAFDGVLILSYLVVYHVGRFGIDALRADGVVVAGALTSHQVASVIFAILAAVAMLRIGSRSEEPHPAHRGSSSEAEEPPRG
jgi:phosphatidylglycerol:prolipoprotein diacylglycerol transferase